MAPVRGALVLSIPFINTMGAIASPVCPRPDPPTQSMEFLESALIIILAMPIMPPQTLAKIVAKESVKVCFYVMQLFF